MDLLLFTITFNCPFKGLKHIVNNMDIITPCLYYLQFCYVNYVTFKAIMLHFCKEQHKLNTRVKHTQNAINK